MNKIIDILPHRDLEQRSKINDAYKALFKENLDLKLHHLSHKMYADVVSALVLPLHKFYAYAIFYARHRSFPDYNILIDIIALRNNTQIKQISEDYKFGEHLFLYTVSSKFPDLIIDIKEVGLKKMYIG